MNGQFRLTIRSLGLFTRPLETLSKDCGRQRPSSFKNIKGVQHRMASSNVFSVGQYSKMTKDKKVTICIEGNIGSGKTFLLDHFASQTGNVQVIPEPVHAWTNLRGHNMLGLLYKDPEKWSFPFQSYVQLTMLMSHQIPHTHPYKMMERSIFSAKYCFVENLYRSGAMSDAEYAVLTEWFNWIITTSYVNVDQIVYLRTTPEQCYERIKKRHRQEESRIPLDYLTKLHEHYEDWLIHRNSFPLPAPVMVIDANSSMEQMVQFYKENEEHILSKEPEVCLVQS